MLGFHWVDCKACFTFAWHITVGLHTFLLQKCQFFVAIEFLWELCVIYCQRSVEHTHCFVDIALHVYNLCSCSLIERVNTMLEAFPRWCNQNYIISICKDVHKGTSLSTTNTIQSTLYNICN